MNERTYVAICRLPGGETAFRSFELPVVLANDITLARFHSYDLVSASAEELIIIDVVSLEEYEDFKPFTYRTF